MAVVIERIGRLSLAIACAAACAGSGAVPRPFPGAALPPGATVPPPVTTPEVPAPAAPETASEPPASPVIAIALMYRGVPYRNGGSDPSGFDCSGFVQWVFAQNGVRLPREVRDQYDAGKKVDLKGVKPGDLLFFETVSRGASHVGVAIGGDQFVHAPSSTGVVRVERFTSAYWSKRFVGARRIP
jgi:cell wall-associated NlpC family hydrolase